ncbi:sensor histidine kinase [Polaribacter tangerinus]|uniref:sensor histidine kinase n=1 Tax=Polaribacter tangerinus TaxID=1920034 RepID=UPI000B4ADD70|nr:sensor histidine kinase [Polaribacter tangerinus]
MKCRLYSIFITFLFLLFSNSVLSNTSDTIYYKQKLIDLKIPNAEYRYTKSSAEKLIVYWNSLYPDDKTNMYNYLSHFRWAKILKVQFLGAKKTTQKKLTTQLALALAIIYHRQTKFELAIPYLNFVLTNKQFISSEQYANVLQRLELSYRSIGSFGEAVEVRKLRVNNENSNNFWELYSVVGMHAEAINDFKLFEKFPIENDFNKITYYNKLGMLFLNNKQIDSARYYFKKMESQADFIIKNENYKGKNSYTEYVKSYFKNLAISQQGECLFLDKKYKEAIPVLKTVLPDCDEIKEVDQKIFKWMTIAKSYNALKSSTFSLAYLDSIKQASQKKRILDLELDWFKQYAIANKIAGNVAAYNTNMEHYFQFKDSIDFINQKNRSLLMLAKFDVTQKKELLQIEKAKSLNLELEAVNKKKIIFFTSLAIVALLFVVFLVYTNLRLQKNAKEKLKLSNQKLLNSSKRIESESKKNEFLLKEIHHRVKNNLQMISSLLSLQNNSIQVPELNEVFNDSKRRIKTMSLVHQQLYENEDYSTISLQIYLTEIVRNTIESFTRLENVKHQIATPFLMPIDNAMLVGLIVNEILTNAIKHNKENAFSFSIYGEEDKGSYTLKIKDTGIGFNKNEEKNQGLGLRLIEILTQQLGAKLRLETALNEGVLYTITKNN